MSLAERWGLHFAWAWHDILKKNWKATTVGEVVHNMGRYFLNTVTYPVGVRVMSLKKNHSQKGRGKLEKLK